jgi:6-methylsalicylate decarboxylase
VNGSADLHQHLWPERLIALLARRRRPPLLERRGRAWWLRLHGEPDCAVDLADHDPARRAALAEADGLERALIGLSTPLGIEALPDDEREPLLDAFHEGVLELGEPFGLWAAGPHAGAEGISVPAAALVSGAAAPLLDWAEDCDLPVLVHPGPPAVAGDVPAWWPALTDYVAQMQAAWLAFATRGRRAHPRLRVVFAMLAGLAPLHGERLAARGGVIRHDPLSFYDVSSYGVRAVDAMIRAVGIDQVVFGSDRPVAEPPRLGGLGAAAEAAIERANPARVLARAVVPA